MTDTKLVNIARLMTTYNIEINQLPDNLKCKQCKLVLKDACQLPCCCRLCRICIEDMITGGDQFCPGDSEDCGKSLLSLFAPDYGANKRILRLTVKCSHDMCVHECQLAYIEQHLQECPRKCEECPFHELGCTQKKLAADEMSGHLQQENRRHSEILIGMIANINREIETLKQRDEASSREIETLKQRNEASSREIETLKQRDEASSREIETLKQRDEASIREIETLKHELVQKDGQIRSIMDQMIHVQSKDKSIKDDIKSIKEEKEDLAGQVRIVTEKIEREVDELRENDELNLARVIDHVDKEIAVVMQLIGSHKEELAIQMQSRRSDIVQAPVGLEQVDCSFVWLVDDDVDKTRWYYGDSQSEYFTGENHPYKYRLISMNSDIGSGGAALRIVLLIYAGSNNVQFAWPFKARVVITVTDRDRHKACRSISMTCRIERPPSDRCRRSDVFEYLHSELKEAGLNLSRGVRVSCVIVPGSAL